MWKYLTLLVVIGFTGCGVRVTPVADFVPIKGKVMAATGPVTEANIVLQPTKTGYMKTVPLKEDGSFSVDLIPGEYAYYFSPTNEQEPEALEAFQKIPAKFQQGDLKRTVTVQPGVDLDLKLE